MQRATVTIKGQAPLSFSKAHNEPVLDKEGHDAYAKRTWRSHLHLVGEKTDEKDDRRVVVPAMMLQNTTINAAKRMAIKVPGKRGATYTKHFVAGIMVMQHMDIGVPIDSVEMEALFLPSDGITGSGKRVWKYYPLILKWGGTVTFDVLDDTITEGVFREVIEEAGAFVGFGRFRPEKRGYYGRFKVEKLVWQ